MLLIFYQWNFHVLLELDELEDDDEVLLFLP